MTGTAYPLLNVIWTMLVFFGWVTWFWLLIVIFGDLFRRPDISGWAKALWTVVLIVLPFIGVLVYLIVEGRQMAARRQERAEVEQSRFDDYVRSVATPTDNGSADQIAKAKRLLDDGAINQDEYETMKRKVLTG